ncbi:MULTISPECIES: hypothetical protein [unclassified Serratia (in: enterobacteria)]|uniref:hypothetical protein n=1 Tax=unclassified Serratia (in: enterobacteria) TaxID=2647522 RepID=UPI0030763DBC
MSSADNSIHHLLWCILVALRSAERDKPFISEMARRRFITAWLDTARSKPGFQGMITEFTSLRQLLDTSDKSIPVDGTLSVLLSHASAAKQCDLFRFRSALNNLMQKGCRLVVCRFPENITTELMQRRQDRRKHALQLTRTENAFQPTGHMAHPVTFQLLLNNTGKTDEEVEMAFHAEGFQVVVANRELALDNKRLVRTLHIGTTSLEPDEWNPRKDDIWQPQHRSDDTNKESYH